MIVSYSWTGVPRQFSVGLPSHNVLASQFRNKKVILFLRKCYKNRKFFQLLSTQFFLQIHENVFVPTLAHTVDTAIACSNAIMHLKNYTNMHSTLRRIPCDQYWYSEPF